MLIEALNVIGRSVAAIVMASGLNSPREAGFSREEEDYVSLARLRAKPVLIAQGHLPTVGEDLSVPIQPELLGGCFNPGNVEARDTYFPVLRLLRDSEGGFEVENILFPDEPSSTFEKGWKRTGEGCTFERWIFQASVVDGEVKVDEEGRPIGSLVQERVWGLRCSDPRGLEKPGLFPPISVQRE